MLSVFKNLFVFIKKCLKRPFEGFLFSGDNLLAIKELREIKMSKKEYF